eukprot:7955549-Pyramimonas_sp.AAC.1
MRVQQLRSFAVLTSQEWLPGMHQDCQDATFSLIRGVGIPRAKFCHASGSSNGCLPTRQFPQWK